MSQDPGARHRLRRSEKCRKLAIERLQDAPKSENAGRRGSEPALKRPRRAHTDKQAHQERKVHSGSVNQHSFENVRSSADGYPPQTASFVCVCEGSLQPLATLTEEPSA